MEIQEFKTKIEAVAAVLKMAVDFASDEDMRWNLWAHLLGPDSQEILVQTGAYKLTGHFRFSGCFPRSETREYSHYGESPSISVSVEKSAEQIARDIERRLMPNYLIALKKAQDQVEASNRYHRMRHETMQKIADYLGGEVKTWDGGKNEFLYVDVKGIDTRIEPYGENTVKFGVEVTPEMAIRIIDLLRNQA